MMNILVIGFRDFLEIIYFISGPILSIGIIIALLQYFQIKKDFFSKYEREIINSTILEVHNFNTKIEPLYDAYKTSLGEDLNFVYDKVYDNLSNEDLIAASEEFDNSIGEDSKKKAEDIVLEISKFSLSFTFLISDDKKAKEIIGAKYIEIYESILFKIVLLTNKKNKNLDSIFKLYNTWNKENQISATKQEIVDNQKRLDDLKKAAEEPLKPIGR